MSFKVVSIGCGRHAESVHGPSWSKVQLENSHVVLAACCDINEQTAIHYRDKFGYRRHYTHIDTMLDAERPDAVSLVAPVDLTMGLALQVMEQGYPIIMEKPPGKTREETIRLVQAARRLGVPNRVAFNRRYAPLSRRLKGMLSNLSSEGGIHSICYDMFRVNRLDEDFSTTAIHAIDMTQYLAGADYEKVRFDYKELPQLGVNVAHFRLDADFENGIKALLHFNPVSGKLVESITVHAHNEMFELRIPMSGQDENGGTLLHYVKGQLVGQWFGKEEGDGTEWFETFGMYNENASFVEDLIKNNEARLAAGSLETALQSVEVADCVRQRKKQYNKISIIDTR